MSAMRSASSEGTQLCSSRKTSATVCPRLGIVILHRSLFIVVGEHPACPYVGGRNGLQRAPADGGSSVLEQTLGLPQTRAIKRVANRARIGEARLRHAQGNVFAQGGLGLGIEAIVHR